MEFKLNLACFYHSVDFDGFFSYTLAKLIYGNYCTFYPYKYEEIDLSILDKHNGYIFIDCSPTTEFITEFLKRNETHLLTIYDHHKSFIDKLNNILDVNLNHKTINVFNHKNMILNYSNVKCGSKIFFDNFAPDIYSAILSHVHSDEINPDLENNVLDNLNRVKNLVNEWDTWAFASLSDDNKTKIDTINFQYYCKEHLDNEHNFYSFIVNDLTKNPNIIDYMIMEGSKLSEIKRLEAIDRLSKATEHSISINGTKANYLKLGLPAEFHIKNNAPKHIDFLVLTNRDEKSDGEVVRVSVVSDNKLIDCSQIVKHINNTGGGHIGAAGVRCSTEEFDNFIKSKRLTIL